MSDIDYHSDLWRKAQELAAQDYDIEIWQEKLSTGEIVYLARSPEIKGCKAQGTAEAVIAELLSAREEFFYFLLEGGLPIPTPRQRQTQTAGLPGSTIHIAYNAGSYI